MNKYHKETIVLETEVGTSKNANEFIKIWQSRIKKHFPHYKIKEMKYNIQGGKKK